MTVPGDKDLVPLDQREARKTYLSPTMTKLTPEQGKLLFTSQVRVGDAGAKDLLEMLVLESSQERCHKDQPPGGREFHF
jgi:hypothetical protein